jgi:hypothetical protein
LPAPLTGEGFRDRRSDSEGNREMSEPGNGTEAAGADLSDEEMVEVVAGQTDSASENADVAGKDWDGDPSQAPAPE